jgi:hypothetical protein
MYETPRPSVNSVSSSAPTSSLPSSQSQNKSMMFTANLDSLDSISELVKKVYATVTPRCIEFPARIRRYGTERRKNVSHFVTLPKVFVDYIFGGGSIASPIPTNNINMEKFDVTFFYDKNLLKKSDRNKEEMFILMKVTKKNNEGL